MCVLGLCAMIDLEQRPQAINQVAGQLLPAAILLFSGLKRAYACRAEHENEDEDDDEDGEDEEENGKATLFLTLARSSYVDSRVEMYLQIISSLNRTFRRKQTFKNLAIKDD